MGGQVWLTCKGHAPASLATWCDRRHSSSCCWNLLAVSVDYLTRPLEVFQEMHRCLKPGGLAVMSFSNRCFPTKGEAVMRVCTSCRALPGGGMLPCSYELQQPLLPTKGEAIGD